MKKKPASIYTAVRIRPDLRKQAEKKAKNENRSLSNYIKNLIIRDVGAEESQRAPRITDEPERPYVQHAAARGDILLRDARLCSAHRQKFRWSKQKMADFINVSVIELDKIEAGEQPLPVQAVRDLERMQREFKQVAK